MGTIRLGAIQVDPARNLIASGGRSWSIEPKIMDLLVAMAARPGEVISREALIDAVWKVEYGADESLTRAVSLLRKTFREAGHAGEIIETIPKRGYRLAVTFAAGPDAEPAIAPVIREPAAEKTETHAAPIPATPPAADLPKSKPPRSPLMLWGGIAAALVVAVVAAITLMPKGGPAEAKQTNQLIAFFGFTSPANDPALSSIVEKTTDAMFESMRGNWFDTVARTETRGVAENRRFERAVETGALYAVSGDARSDGGGATLSMRVEDVPTRLTLWEGTITSPAADVAYLPAQATWQMSSVLWCIIKTREGLTHDTTELLSLIADRCKEGGLTTSRNASYAVSRMRAIVQADPGSAYNQAQLVNLLGGGAQYAPGLTRDAWLAEADAALKRASELNPRETNIYFARLNLAVGKNIQAPEYDKLLLDALANSEATDNFALASANGMRAALLASVGRFTEGVPYAVARAANRSVLAPGFLGMAQAQAGMVREAQADLEPTLAAYGPQVWETFIPHAFFLGAPDADAMLASPPSTIPKPTVDCLREIRKALVSTDARVRATGAKKATECREASAISWRVSLAARAALGDLDGAFAEAQERSFSLAAIRGYETTLFFFPATRAMRADPRFLPLVEKLGMMDYWRATKSQPDVCATEAAPFCTALKTTNAQP